MSNRSIEVTSSRSLATADGRGDVKIKTIISSTTFQCLVLPPANSISGTLVPRVVQKGRHRRRIISIELHRIEHPQTQDAKNIGSTNIDTPSFYDECVVRVLVPIPRVNRRKNNNKAKNDDDVDDDVEEEDSTTMIAAEFLDHESTEIIFPSNGSSNNNNINDSGQQYATEEITGWVAKYRFPLQKMSIKGTHHHSVIIELLMGKRREVREVVFDSLPEAERFQTVLRNEMAMEQSRILAKTKFSMGGENIRLDDQITFLVEIVSGWNLPAADFSSSDPFVTCLLNNKEVHRTAYISKTLDPVWSASTGSLFLLIVDVQELFAGEGLICIVYDFDKVGANDMLGAVTISPLTMYHANGERMEFKLGLAPGQKITDIPGYMAFRVRHATENDKVFMAQYGKTNWMIPNLTETKKPDSHEHKAKGGKGNIMSMVTRRSRMCKSGGNAGLLEYKVRPCPDPKRKEETTWMTKTHIDSECLQDSSHWVDAGNGTLGRIFVEILHCDDLPNLDAGGFAGNKTDTFVCLVYEDAVAQTDVIDDTLMPRWLPWTRRAFIFHMLHGSSELFLGVFDHDDGINPTDDHDLIGRVSVDLSNLRKDTVYTLQYNIYTTARMTARKKKGSITIRLRIEFDDERNLLLSTIEPPPKLYVNVKTRKEFRVVRYTCTGKYNMEKYNMKFIDSYIDELLVMQHFIFYAQDGVMALLLWRGTVPCHLPFLDRTCMLPTHSMAAFVLSVLTVERPQLLPSVVFACIAWFMIATQEYRRSIPDVWSRCKSFRELAEILILGQSQTPPDSIKVGENSVAAKEYLDSWKKRIEDAEEAASKAYQEQLKSLEAYEREMEEIGDTGDLDIATKSSGGVSIDPFQTILFPVQQNLAMLCRYIRHVKHVASWQECYIAFWVTAGCFLLSFVCLFIPWFFIIQWVARVTVWTLFGPWMKLVDIYYVTKLKPLTEEEQRKKKYLEREKRDGRTQKALSDARLKREEQVKLKDMKKILFGKFITRVPVLKEDRYRDLPTAESHAKPHRPKPSPISELAMKDAGYNKKRMAGQHLIGDMIPKIELPSLTDAPVGQPTSYMSLVDKHRPGGSVLTGMESTVAAYIKLGTLVATAGVLTWFGVPILAAITQFLISYAQ